MIKKKFCNLSHLKNKNFFKSWVKEFRDEIIVFKYKNKIYAKSSICPHFGGPISYDKEKSHLYCFWHGLKFSVENGKCLKIAPGEPVLSGEVITGKLIVEGKNLYDSDSAFIKERRKYSFTGLVLISIIINNDLSIEKNILLSSKGIPEFDSVNILNEFKSIFIDRYIKLTNDQKNSDKILSELIKVNIRQIFKNSGKSKPEVDVHILRN